MNDDKSTLRSVRCRVVGAAAKVSGTGRYFAWVVSFLLLLLSTRAFAADEQTLGVLQVGQHTYQDVKVRTKARDYILIVHSSGITSIKVTQLPAEVLQSLGYGPAVTAQERRGSVAALTRTSLAKGDALVGGAEAKLFQVWRKAGLASRIQPFTTYPAVAVVGALLLMAHLFCSYCCLLICQKTGNHPGILVWLPLLQAIPMLRAASMSARWFWVLLIPGLNLVAYVLWSVRIVEARRKTMPLAILLVFPLTSWFAFLFLAFSQDSRDEGIKVQVEAMTLQTVCASGTRYWKRMLLQSEQHITA